MNFHAAFLYTYFHKLRKNVNWVEYVNVKVEEKEKDGSFHVSGFIYLWKLL